MQKINKGIISMKLLMTLSVLFIFSCKPEPIQEISSSENIDENVELIPFTNYIDYVEKLDYNEISDRSQARTTDFGDMKDHILEMYKGVKVTKSYLMKDNRTCDCIPILQQAGLRRGGVKAELEPMPTFNPSDIEHPSLDTEISNQDMSDKQASTLILERSNDKYGNSRQCPEGFIPMIRLDLDKMTEFNTLDDFFHKCPDGDCLLVSEDESNKTEAVGRRYAFLNQNINNHGGNSALNIWQPTTPAGNNNSISQQWYTSGSGSSTQTVEGGWIVTSNRPTQLFIYFTNAGYAPGSGCYNLDCQGFVQVDNQWAMGERLNGISQYGGNQYDFTMRWYKNGTNGAWWLWLEGNGKGAGKWIGYYPAALYGSGQMSRHATNILYGGEVTFDPSTSLGMGSGRKANEGWSRAAYQRQVYFYDTNNTPYWFSNGAENETAPSCYTIDKQFSSNGSWGTYFYYGGASCN